MKLKVAEDVNQRIKLQCQEATQDCEKVHETNRALEDEVNAYKSEMADLEAKHKSALKNEILIQKFKEEIENLRNEFEASEQSLKALKKLEKSKDKEIYDLKKENSNLSESSLRVKSDFTTFKCAANKEKKEFEKQVKKLEKEKGTFNVKPEYQCTKCNVETESLCALKHHMLSYHIQTKSTQTKEVVMEDKKVQSVGEFKSDKNVQTTVPSEVGQYNCFYCDKTIDNEASLSEHRSKCSGASNKFLKETNHIETCSGTTSSFWKQSTFPVKPAFTEEDVKSCDFCGFKFGTLSGLRNHIRSLHKEMLQAQLMLPT